MQGVRAAASFEAALAAFTRAGFAPADAYNAVKATVLTALAVGLEQSLAARGSTAETDELPPDRFPQLSSLGELADPGPAWAFSVETLVAGLRAQLAVRTG